MDFFNLIAGSSSIIALGITIYQVSRITKIKKSVNNALNEFKEKQKRASFQEWLSKSRDLTNELTSITNNVTNRRYRGGEGRELKNRIEIFLGNLDEFITELPNEAIYPLQSIKEKIKIINFEEIENNTQGAISIKEDFQKIRNALSQYLRG